jgi:hypothetical protein
VISREAAIPAPDVAVGSNRSGHHAAEKPVYRSVLRVGLGVHIHIHTDGRQPDKFMERTEPPEGVRHEIQHEFIQLDDCLLGNLQQATKCMTPDAGVVQHDAR